MDLGIGVPLAGMDFPWLAKISSLLVLPFAHEDLAIGAGAYIVVNDLMPVTLVSLALYGGIVASDFALYGLGAGARRVPWLGRRVGVWVERVGDQIGRDIFGLLALCRIVPGVVFVACVACGWARVPLARFTAATLLVSALYLPIMLYLVIAFGDAVDDRAGWWTWPLLAGLLIMAGFVRGRVFSFGKGERVLASA